MYNLALLAK